MAFSPRFLDEIRARLTCSEVIGRRVRLIKKAREYLGLCPFHNEKTPSFTVNDDKGFFHCFGCGAHGDVIGFTMRIDRLTFPEAVERLAGEAGLELPRQSGAELAREELQKSLYDVLESACAWFEAQLRTLGGRVALSYLTGRGVDDQTIMLFRLGYAPDSRSALKSAMLGKGFTESQLIDAGLIMKPDDGRDSFDFFRGRVMFPIMDRRGRVIAFGGRVIGDGQPKYLNSRDTTLFEKGRNLYAYDKAREGVRAGADLVVAEGYMDVIALHKAGFTGAVAPLGTALTEWQIDALWKLKAEPIICLDGDAAGQRAAMRAAERALPLLRPGYSLKFAILPSGEDPDSLLRQYGAQRMKRVLTLTQPLSELIWLHEVGQSKIDTPELRALFDKKLQDIALKINDRTVQFQYLRLFRSRIWNYLIRYLKTQKKDPSEVIRGTGDPSVLLTYPEKVLIAVVLNHDLIYHKIFEEFNSIDFKWSELNKLRNEINHQFGEKQDLDSLSLQRNLRNREYDFILDAVLNQHVYLNGRFASPYASYEEALQGWAVVLRGLSVRPREQLWKEALQKWADDPTQENWDYAEAMRREFLEVFGDIGTNEELPVHATGRGGEPLSA